MAASTVGFLSRSKYMKVYSVQCIEREIESEPSSCFSIQTGLIPVELCSSSELVVSWKQSGSLLQASHPGTVWLH